MKHLHHAIAAVLAVVLSLASPASAACLDQQCACAAGMHCCMGGNQMAMPSMAGDPMDAAMAAAMQANCPMRSAGEPASMKCAGNTLCPVRAGVVTPAVVNPERKAIQVVFTAALQADAAEATASGGPPPGPPGALPLARHVLFQVFRI